ncbi:MAG: cupin domain-containing protein [Candidatus Marinimicrobia bacterium]|nr:cupin domain-containing protein [Candidatus Neomarinimicrobiota bacterium]
MNQPADYRGRPLRLENEIDYAPDAIVSKTLLKNPAGNLTLFAFDAGQELSEHTSPYDAVLQVVSGQAQVEIAGEPREISAGQWIIMPANIPHNVVAAERFKMLLVMIRGRPPEAPPA